MRTTLWGCERVRSITSRVAPPSWQSMIVPWALLLPERSTERRLREQLKPPSAKLAAGAQATVVDVAAPPLSFTFPTQKVKSIPIDLGHVILNLTFTVTGSMTVACLSPISQTFSMANYQAQAKAKLGPYASSFNYDAKSKAGSLTLGLASVKAKDLTFSGSMGIVTGGASVSIGVKTISRKVGDMQLSGSFSAKAEGRFVPNPKPQPVDAGPIYVMLGGMVILLGGAVLAQIGRAAAAEAAASAGPGLAWPEGTADRRRCQCGACEGLLPLRPAWGGGAAIPRRSGRPALRRPRRTWPPPANCTKTF